MFWGVEPPCLFSCEGVPFSWMSICLSMLTRSSLMPIGRLWLRVGDVQWRSHQFLHHGFIGKKKQFDMKFQEKVAENVYEVKQLI